ncbi:MAG TPA: nucleotidyltransferase domain-containing protein [Candidatus Wolfebacteria bacterium]|nr:nucleotidyltransferase domain-containing protein [Candidatus Wolfebacteria bacterium]
MKLEHYQLEKLKKELISIVGKYLDLTRYRIFFFGSRASGSSNERSDIDIGIKGPKNIPLTILRKIEEELDELPMLYKIEVVDFNSVAPEFQKVALQHSEVIK